MALSAQEVIRLFGDPLAGKPARIMLDGYVKRIVPDVTWQAANIVAVALPFGQGKEWRGHSHRLIAPLLKAAFSGLEGAGLLYLVETVDGCYVPRLVGGGDSLSRHTWGIAIDLNARRFPLGSAAQQDSRLVLALAKHGFRCGQKGGGLWQKTLDPMHFEFAAPSLLVSCQRQIRRGEPEAAENDMAAIPIKLPGGRQVAGTVEDGVLYGPVRPVAEALGGTIQWDAAAKAAIIRKE